MVMGKRVLIWGMARSGAAAAKLACDAGAMVRVNDLKTADALSDAIDALKGENIEWRLGEEIENVLDGVDIAVISPGIPVSHPAVKTMRERGIEVIGELELAYRMGRGRVVAVSGTNGKTTTTTLLGEIFKNMGRVTYVVGNIGDPYSAYAARMKDEDMVVCEVSSFQLETVDTFHPEISCILNITEDHLNRHGGMDGYIRIKERLFENQCGSDICVLNWDDPVTRDMARRVPCAVAWFSREDTPEYGAFLRDGMVVFGTSASYVAICRADEIFIPAPHNLENALAAAAAAMSAGAPAPVIRHTLRTFRGVEHRIETVRTVDGVRYINDSKGTNVDSTLKAVDTMTAPTVLIAGGSEKNADFTPLGQRIVESTIQYAVLIGRTGQRIGDALTRAGFADWEYVGFDFQKAIDTARAHAKPGGNVLLSPACASFDMFTDYEQRGREFKRIVAEMKETQP